MGCPTRGSWRALPANFVIVKKRRGNIHRLGTQSTASEYRTPKELGGFLSVGNHVNEVKTWGKLREKAVRLDHRAPARLTGPKNVHGALEAG